LRRKKEGGGEGFFAFNERRRKLRAELKAMAYVQQIGRTPLSISGYHTVCELYDN